MNLFDIVIIDILLVMFPFLVYFVYTIYAATLNSENKAVFFDSALVSSYYLLLKFGYLHINEISILLFNIPLIIAYLKHKKISIALLSILIIINYYTISSISIIYLIFEYLIYFVLYLFYRKSDHRYILFVAEYVVLKIIFYTIGLFIIDEFIFRSYIISVLSFVSITYFIIFLCHKVMSILDLYKQLSSIKQNEELKKSLFNITHEIKNPIAVCKGYLDMIDLNDKTKSTEYVNIIKCEISRLLFLLEDFLSITKVKIEKEEMDLNMLLEDTVKCMNPYLKNKRINFVSNITDEEIYIDADYNRLKQTLVNIIKNSCESIENEGTIKIYTKKKNKNIEIWIEDDGVGMTNEELKNLKQAFFTTKKTGTGLGVYLSNELIKSHNGTLDYYSKKNIGTKTLITLPLMY